MKKFTNIGTEVKPKYESKDSLKNELFALIDETLTVKITNEIHFIITYNRQITL